MLQPDRCVKLIATHLLRDKFTVENAVLSAFERFNRRGTIFDAAAFILPYCSHPMFRIVRPYLRQLIYPFDIPRRNLYHIMRTIDSLDSVRAFIKRNSNLPEDIVLLWLLVHNHMNVSVIREVLLSGTLVYRY